jgi:hypothetical protein
MFMILCHIISCRRENQQNLCRGKENQQNLCRGGEKQMNLGHGK